MIADFISALCMMGMSVPFLAIVFLLVHYYVRRAAWKRRKRLRKRRQGFCPSAAALGLAFLMMPLFYRPSVECVIEAKLDEDVEEDDQGDPETPARHLHRQLRKIRRGERLETLVLRL